MHHTLCDIYSQDDKFFREISVVLEGNFGQILPVIPHAIVKLLYKFFCRSSSSEASFKSSDSLRICISKQILTIKSLPVGCSNCCITFNDMGVRIKTSTMAYKAWAQAGV